MNRSTPTSTTLLRVFSVLVYTQLHDSSSELFEAICFQLVRDFCRRTQDVISDMETKNTVIDKRRKSRKTGGHVNMWPEVKRDGVFYPRETRLRNICRQALEDVMFSKDKNSFSLSHTKTLCCERTGLKAWLLFHLNSVAHVLLPTPWFFPSSCVKQVSHLDTKQFAPCSPSLPKSVFTPVSVPLKREERSD